MKAPIFVLFMLTGLIAVSPAFAGYIPSIRPYTGYNNGGYKPSESSEYYKIKPQKQSTQLTPTEQVEKIEQILEEIKNSKMSKSLEAIKLIPKENRIESNPDYTYLMNQYNAAREVWLKDNSQMLEQGLLQDPGDASYYEEPLTEMQQCIKESKKDCNYQFKIVDGTHSQKEIDDAASSRKWLEEQNRQETIKQFLLILFCLVSFAGAVWVLKLYVLNFKPKKH